MKCFKQKHSLFIDTMNFPYQLNFVIIQWMNGLSNNIYDIQTMSTQSNKECPNWNRWFTTQKSFKHHIRHCRRADCEEMFNDMGSSAANPLLSKFTPGVETTVLQQSNLNQSFDDEYEDIEQIEDFAASTFDSDSCVNNDKEFNLSRPNISTGKINCFYRYIILYQVNILLVQYGKCLCT
jgi:hypothetical protein